MGLLCIQEPQLQPLTRIYPREQHTHTIILLHGRDSNSSKFSKEFCKARDSNGRTLPEIFPSMKWVFPSSKMRNCERELGLQRSQWFDMWDERSPSERQELQIGGLSGSVTFILEIVKTEVRRLGAGGAEKVVLGGFEQGCATAIWALLCGEVGLGGFVGIRGWMPLVERVLLLEATRTSTAAARSSSSGSTNNILQETRRFAPPFSSSSDSGSNDYLLREICTFLPLPSSSSASSIRHVTSTILETPVFLTHSTDSRIVDIEHGRKLHEALAGLGMSTEAYAYQEYDHWITEPADVDDLVAFLSESVQVNQTPYASQWDEGLF
jgi:lysophospholipase-2